VDKAPAVFRFQVLSLFLLYPQKQRKLFYKRFTCTSSVPRTSLYRRKVTEKVSSGEINVIFNSKYIFTSQCSTIRFRPLKLHLIALHFSQICLTDHSNADTYQEVDRERQEDREGDDGSGQEDREEDGGSGDDDREEDGGSGHDDRKEDGVNGHDDTEGDDGSGQENTEEDDGSGQEDRAEERSQARNQDSNQSKVLPFNYRLSVYCYFTLHV